MYDGETAISGFGARVRAIINEAEQVATELYGVSKTPQEQQDEAWNEKPISVFDLETYEKRAEMDGEVGGTLSRSFNSIQVDPSSGGVRWRVA